MAETLAPTTTYCTLARIGYWASLDAKVETRRLDEYGILSHDVDFVLIGKFGDRVHLGFSIIDQSVSDPPRHDLCHEEVGVAFPYP